MKQQFTDLLTEAQGMINASTHEPVAVYVQVLLKNGETIVMQHELSGIDTMKLAGLFQMLTQAKVNDVFSKTKMMPKPISITENQPHQ